VNADGTEVLGLEFWVSGRVFRVMFVGSGGGWFIDRARNAGNGLERDNGVVGFIGMTKQANPSAEGYGTSRKTMRKKDGKGMEWMCPPLYSMFLRAFSSFAFFA
jgi:hypothetical protein